MVAQVTTQVTSSCVEPSSLDFRKRYLMSCGAGTLINMKEVSTILKVCIMMIVEEKKKARDLNTARSPPLPSGVMAEMASLTGKQ